jgi:hypothetical protein
MVELEQGCVRPGVWLIEGRTVTRQRINRRTRWVVDYFGDVQTTDTLREARQAIADEVAPPETYRR